MVTMKTSTESRIGPAEMLTTGRWLGIRTSVGDSEHDPSIQAASTAAARPMS
jgi:hypothetical protein